MIAILLFLLSTQPPPAAPAAETQLVNQIKSVIEKEYFKDGFWGVAIYAPLRGKWLYRLNAEKNFRPASNLKILTTLSAFEFLGENYRFQTIFSYTGKLEQGILFGDLVIRGGGDPSFSGRYEAAGPSSEALLAELAARLRESGLREIRGDLFADLSFFDDVALAESWELGDLGSQFGTPVSPLNFNDGQFQLAISSSASGKLSWGIRPTAPDIEVDFALNPEGSHKLDYSYGPGSNRVLVKGKLGNCKDLFRNFSSWDPSRLYLENLREALEREGVKVNGSLRVEGPAPEKALSGLYLHESEPLGQIARVLMRRSQNHYADCFLKTLGAEKTGVGSYQAGEKWVRQLLKKSTLSNDYGLVMRDGSGLSPHNHCKPLQLVAALDLGLQATYRDSWIACLPRFGKEGTVKNRGSKGVSVGQVWAKTGNLSHVRTLAGYVETLEGEPLIFALMVNGYSCPIEKVNLAQDQICEFLVKLPAPPGADKTDSRWGQLNRSWQGGVLRVKDEG